MHQPQIILREFQLNSWFVDFELDVVVTLRITHLGTVVLAFYSLAIESKQIMIYK